MSKIIGTTVGTPLDPKQVISKYAPDDSIDPSMLDRNYWEYTKSHVVETPSGLLNTLTEKQIMRVKALNGSALYSQLGDNEAIAIKTADGFLLFDLNNAKRYKYDPMGGLEDFERIAEGDIDSEYLFSETMRAKYLGLPMVKVTPASLNDDWFNAQTTPGIYQVRSSGNEPCVLIVLKPDTSFHLMQIKLGNNKFEYRSCETDVANNYFADSWTDWVDLTAGGTAIIIQNVAESTADSGSNVITFSDGTTLTIKNGSKGSKGDKGDKGDPGEKGETGSSGANGQDGHTPVKGVDYYTDEDKAEFENHIASELVKRGQLKPEFANDVSECTDTSKLYVLPDGFIYAYMTVEAAGGIEEVTEQITGEFTEGSRLSTSSGSLSTLAGAITTPLIDIRGYGDVFTIHLDSANGGTADSVKWAATSQTTGNSMCLYKDGSFLLGGFTGASPYSGITYKINSANDVDITFDTASVPSSALGFTHVRFSGVKGNVDTVVVSVTYEKEVTGGTETKWTNTGHAFVPADYEDRIVDIEDDVAKLKNSATSSSGTPYYVVEEAEAVADKVINVRNAHSFVFGAVSDTHTTGSDTSATGVLHAGMGMDEVNGFTQLDLVANFGDVMVGYLDDTYKEGFKLVKSAFKSVGKAVPYIQLQGNHDQISSDTTEEAQQKYFAYIGANNVGSVTDWDNRFRNYGYRDFDSQKMRVIYLNTADVSEAENTKDVWVTAEQYSWLINTALNFTDKDNPTQWGFVVFSHHPLNWYNLDNLLTVLNAYKGKLSGSITQDSVVVSYNFINATAELIAHFHGHLHNFRAEKLGTNNVVTITIPNACFDRNNEYGTSSSYSDEVREAYGDTDAEGNQRQFAKTANTAKDTAFNVVVVDRENRKIHCFNYGAGIDREISY